MIVKAAPSYTVRIWIAGDYADALRLCRQFCAVEGAFLEDACVVTGDATDNLLARDLVQAFNFWRFQRGEGPFGETTVAKKIKERSRRWRSRSTGQRFTEGKSVGISRYSGIRWNDVFGRAWRDAPRDQRGRPIGTAVAEGEA